MKSNINKILQSYNHALNGCLTKTSKFSAIFSCYYNDAHCSYPTNATPTTVNVIFTIYILDRNKSGSNKTFPLYLSEKSHANMNVWKPIIEKKVVNRSKCIKGYEDVKLFLSI